MLSIGEDEDLGQAIDVLRELRLAGHLEGVPTFYPTLRAAVMLTDDAVQTPKRQLTGAEVRAIGERTGVGAWAARGAVWGDRDIADLKLAKIRAAWEAIPSGKMVSPRLLPAEYGEIELAAEKIQAGIPTLKAIEMTPDHVARVGFSPVVPLTGSEMTYVIGELRSRILGAGLNFSGGIMMTGERSAVVVCGMQFDRTDAASVRNTYALAKRFERIKDAIDPNGILSPGRHGIWPRAYREQHPASQEREGS
jgi:4-cresol dehydrogenase (hydroxylating)